MRSTIMFAFAINRFCFVLVGLSCFCFVWTSLCLAEQPANQRSIGDYRRDVKTFMKLSKSEDTQIQRNAIFNLCALHYELVSDSRFRTSTQVQSFRVVVANRLEGYSKEQAKAQKRLAKKRDQKRQHDSDIEESKSDSSQSVEQTEDEAVYESALRSYESLSQFSGGPVQVFDYAGGRLGAPWDNGLVLVDLIQNTIDPSFWRDNGGNGTIHYYRPSRVLVINGSQRIQEMTEDLLWKLRAAN